MNLKNTSSTIPAPAPVSQNDSKCPTPDETHGGRCPIVGHSPGISARKQAAIEMILTGATDTAVAEALMVTRKTIYRWRVEDTQFRAHLDRRRRELFDNASDRLRNLLGSALDRLTRQVNDPYASTSLRAARTLLALARVGQAVSDAREPHPVLIRDARSGRHTPAPRPGSTGVEYAATVDSSAVCA
jgi:hypothetical protein